MVANFRVPMGMTQKKLAELAGIHEETIASIEQGRRPLQPDVATRLDTILNTKGTLSVAVRHLPDFDQAPRGAEAYFEYEREALTICWYEAHIVPGLLQTEAYALSLFRGRVPTFPEKVIERHMETRMGRQEILRRDQPPSLTFVLWEPILLNPLGGPDVHAEQVRHLRACADLPFLTLQVMPLSSTGHPGVNGAFLTLETPEHQLLAYAESQHGSSLIMDPEEVSVLSQRYGMLRTQALNVGETRDLLDRRLGELEP
ncbi:Scr1 family TA system antitoxin-like transcriptional regulator [Streptomyces sp. NPDC101118]|uniref:helix-turn-helix domain-containing protein n=1 Tax=Streptomyces sp. NPDC101118 TaxID=3366109 RepID=UPI00382D2345